MKTSTVVTASVALSPVAGARRLLAATNRGAARALAALRTPLVRLSATARRLPVGVGPYRRQLDAEPALPPRLHRASRLAVGRGDLVVFRFEGGEFANHFKGQRFFKRIAGVAGDEITLQGRNIFINGAAVGFARSRTLDGTTLEAIAPGVIPADRFYVQGTHEMSFDSRYRVNGLVRRDQIIGKATVIF